MEGSSSTSNFRSVSLPSRLTHPSSTKIETKINDMKALVISNETIQSGWVGLGELYVFVDELVQSPHAQQALSRKQNGTLIDDTLEGSVVLLDLCSTIKDLIMLMKENMQILQSALQRKGGDLVASQIASYLSFRKNTKKSITKSLQTLKHLEKKMGSFLFPNTDHHVIMLSKALGEVNGLTISIFKSLLVFISLKTKPINGAHLLSKFLSKSSTSTHYSNKTFVNEVEMVDMATTSLLKSARNNEIKNVDVQTTIKNLQILDISIDGIEAGLDCLFRRLVQSRSSLLNIVVC